MSTGAGFLSYTLRTPRTKKVMTMQFLECFFMEIKLDGGFCSHKYNVMFCHPHKVGNKMRTQFKHSKWTLTFNTLYAKIWLLITKVLFQQNTQREQLFGFYNCQFSLHFIPNNQLCKTIHLNK